MSDQEQSGDSGLDVDPKKGVGGYREPADPTLKGTPRGPVQSGEEGDHGKEPANDPANTMGEDTSLSTGASTEP